jgi:CxxC-x17-CxxC domain-containing protein
MSFQNRSLTCADCGASFDFTAEEQEFHAGKGFTNDPKRCMSCRQVRKAERDGGGYGGSFGSRPPREMHAVVCAECGKDTEVPFKPTGDRPVYCSDCFSKNSPRR